MKQLIMTLGLPGCGKSTWARETMAAKPGAYKRVTKDLLRECLDCGRWSHDNERFLIEVRDYIVGAALNAGKHVIVDDTNLAPKHQERLRQLAKQYGAAFEIKDFTDVPIEVCIERDLKRPASVGESVIRKMYRDYLTPKPVPIPHDLLLPDCIIVDIDGTVARMTGRSPYDYSRVNEDVPNIPVCRIVHNELQSGEARVLFVSGRKAECRSATESWLNTEFGAPGYTISESLFMRADGDDRDDRIIKREIYEREIKGKYNVRYVLDDRNRTVAGWRSLGLTCFQVADGDF